MSFKAYCVFLYIITKIVLFIYITFSYISVYCHFTIKSTNLSNTILFSKATFTIYLPDINNKRLLGLTFKVALGS